MRLSTGKTESDTLKAGGTRPAVVSGCPGLDSADRFEDAREASVNRFGRTSLPT